jgi:hypothetical protein
MLPHEQMAISTFPIQRETKPTKPAPTRLGSPLFESTLETCILFRGRLVEAQARRFHTYPPPPGPLAISPSSELPEPRISHFLPTALCTILRLGRIASRTHACMPRRAERTNYHLPSSPLPPSPASAPIEAGNQSSQGVPFNYSCTCAHDTAFTSNTCQRRPVH